MTFNPKIHHRRSIRLRGYDYSRVGAYFVTMCAWQGECLFGEVADGEVRLNEIGKIVQHEWCRTPIIRPTVELDAYVVMPNHFHAILCIHNVGAHCMRPVSCDTKRLEKSNNRAHISAPLRRKPDSIGSIIAGFKSTATKHINALRDTPGSPVWQRNYYEQIVRNDGELDSIRHYITENPGKWEEDQNHPTRILRQEA